MQQFRLFRGKSGRFFVENTTTKKQSSLRTRDEAEAQRLLFAKNEPIICLQMARAYLTAADPVMKDRTIAAHRTTRYQIFGSAAGRLLCDGD